jgi:hypothetical protein
MTKKIKLYCAGVVNDSVVPMKEHEDGDWLQLEDVKALVKQAYISGNRKHDWVEDDADAYVKEVLGDD